MPAILFSIQLLLLLAVPVEWLTPKEHDFGEIDQGKPVHVSFQFKNNGSEPLLIDNVRTTCGCTAPDWDERPIEPGKVSNVNIEFDASKVGYFRKKITVWFHHYAKAEKLYIEGTVK